MNKWVEKEHQFFLICPYCDTNYEIGQDDELSKESGKMKCVECDNIFQWHTVPLYVTSGCEDHCVDLNQFEKNAKENLKENSQSINEAIRNMSNR